MNPSGASARGGAAVRPPLGTMVWRGARRCCPWCGDRRAYFTGWFAKQDACRRCGVGWRRSDVGFEFGAATVNTIITFGLIVVGLGVGLVATAPDFAVVELLVGLVVAAAVVPVVVYPISYTLWQSLDLAMRPPAPGELPPSGSDELPPSGSDELPPSGSDELPPSGDVHRKA